MAEVERLLETVRLLSQEVLPWPRGSGKPSLPSETGILDILVLGKIIME